MDWRLKSCLAAGSVTASLMSVLVPAPVLSQDIGRVVRTEQLQMTGRYPGVRAIRTGQLQMTGLHPGARVIRTGQLQMTGLHPGVRAIPTEQLQMPGPRPVARVVRTGQLQMTGLHPGARVIRTGQLQMTGLGETAIGVAVEELSGVRSPQSYGLQYPVAELEYPSYELSGVATRVEGE